ncbi:MAG: glycoside hydrolase family 31 protein [Anaerolineaceae bacterium]|nr:glycoside hydrolase family 31 protein [Anaerolineaceae bacterium]
MKGEYFNQEPIHAQIRFQRITSVKPNYPIPGGMRFYSERGPMDVYFYAPGVIRFNFQVKEVFDYGLLVGCKNDVDSELIHSNSSLIIRSGDVTAEIFYSPFSIKIKNGDKNLIESITDFGMEGKSRFHPFSYTEDNSWQISLALKSGEAVFGLGEKFGKLNHRGELITSWNYDSLGINSERCYKNNPFAWSPEGWGLLVHTPGKVMHAVGYAPWSHRSYILRVEDANLDFFFFVGDSPKEILNKYTDLTGKSPELPLWSYGLWMARAYYQTADELLNVVRKMREKQIPLDVILLDGRAWHKLETRFDFSWDPDRYPDPKAFMKQLADLEVRLCLWEYPYISTYNPLFSELASLGYLLKNKNGSPYIHYWTPPPYETLLPQLSPSGIIDFTNPKAYEWYRDQHKDLFELGVALMKTDFGESVPDEVVAHNGDSGERLHNVYTLLYNQCVYEATRLYGHGKPMVWGRSAWTGSQRYPMGWGGDPQSDWEGLAASIRGVQSWGMSGGAYSAHDIGGWYGTLTDPELFVRWAQAGVMCSHTRFHGVGEREPWIFGPEVEAIITQWIRFRYRLIPYVRWCEREAIQNGIPVMRSMVLAFPEDKAAWGFEEQYMLGNSLLVAPIIQPAGNVDVYLPKGDWFHVWSGVCYKGGQVVSFKDVSINEIPVFGRVGTCLPLGPVVQHTGQLKEIEDIEELWVFGEPQPELCRNFADLKWETVDGKIKFIPSQGVKVKLFESEK